MKFKTWITKQLLNCTWLKEALYEALYKEYVEKLRQKNIDLMNELDELKVTHKQVLRTLENKIKEIDAIKKTFTDKFPGTFEEILSKLTSIVDKIMPAFAKSEEVPVKKKRKYNKKKKDGEQH